MQSASSIIPTAQNKPTCSGLFVAKRSQQIPIVLSPDEAFAIIQQTTGVYKLMLQLLYGGLRLRECMQLRVKDIDFAQSQLVIRCGKSGKDRVTLLPQSLIEPLQIHLQQVRLIHQQDLELGYGATILPFAFHRKDPMLADNGFGNLSFPHQLAVKILDAEVSSDIISITSVSIVQPTHSTLEVFTDRQFALAIYFCDYIKQVGNVSIGYPCIGD